MHLNRRSFLQGLGASTALTYTGLSFESAHATSDTRLSILQGYTDTTSTELSVVVQNKKLRYLLFEDRALTPILPTQKWNVDWSEASTRSVDKLIFENLKPNVIYQLQVINEQNHIVDSRTLSTLNLARRDLHVAWLSCMNDMFHNEQKRMWSSVRQSKPDLLFFVGDSVYCDSPLQMIGKVGANPKQIWRRYVETRESLAFYKFDHLIPVLSVWDDHDYGKNDADSTYPYKEDSKKIFETFFGRSRETLHFRKGPGVSSVFEACGQKFILVDNRTFKTEQCYWGTRLTDWVLDEIKTSTNPVWLMQGQQFFGGYHRKGSFEHNCRDSLKKITQEIKNLKTPLILVSGDVHYSEISQLEKELLGFETIEITSSSLHSMTRPPKPNNKRRITSTGQRNFVAAKISHTSQGLNLDTYIRTDNNQNLWQKNLTLMF